MESVNSAPEQPLAHWQEPSDEGSFLGAYSTVSLAAGSATLTLLLIGLALWQHGMTYYLAAAVAALGGFSLIMQKRMPSRQLEVALTTQNLQLGTKSYLLDDLAGFWLDDEDEECAINVEPKKAAMIPITCIYPGSKAEARQIMLQVLPELEPRQKSISDGLSRYIRL